MTTPTLTARSMLQLLLRRPQVARGSCVAVSHKRGLKTPPAPAAAASESSKESGGGGGGFFGSFFDKRQVLPQTTAHSAQLSMKHRDGRPV